MYTYTYTFTSSHVQQARRKLVDQILLAARKEGIYVSIRLHQLTTEELCCYAADLQAFILASRRQAKQLLHLKNQLRALAPLTHNFEDLRNTETNEDMPPPPPGFSETPTPTTSSPAPQSPTPETEEDDGTSVDQPPLLHFTPLTQFNAPDPLDSHIEPRILRRLQRTGSVPPAPPRPLLPTGSRLPCGQGNETVQAILAAARQAFADPQNADVQVFQLTSTPSDIDLIGPDPPVRFNV